MAPLLLTLSILLSTGRNLLSKRLSSAVFGTRAFFMRQSILFLGGTLAILLFGGVAPAHPSPKTILYALLYALCLILAQWFYTVSLNQGNTALCSTVYSMGFILPTVSGAVIWSETFSALDVCGVVCAILSILLPNVTVNPSNASTKKQNPFPLLTATLASGGLGILQKLQQRSDVANERAHFLLIAFLLASAISVLASFFSKKEYHLHTKKAAFPIALGIGIAFGSCNLLNTALAGMLPGAVFFPTLNIGVILLTMLCSVLLFHEKLKRGELLTPIFGCASILLLNLT